MELSICSRERLEAELLGEPEVNTAQCTDVHGGGYAVANSTRAAQLQHRLAVARELLLRDAGNDLEGRCPFDSPQKVREYLQLYFATLEREVFVVLLLDAQHRLIGIDEMFRGTLTQTSVYPREVVRAALQRNCGAVMFAHNHPSGHAEPSRADEFLTQSLKTALALIDVRVLDHFIVASGRLTSMAELGQL